MLGSRHTIRRALGLAVTAGAFAGLVPVAPGGGFQGSPDAIDRAIAVRQVQLASRFQGSPDAADRATEARQAQLASRFQGSPDAADRATEARQAQEDAAFDGREHAALALPRGVASDVVERAVRAHERDVKFDLESMPDVVERAAAAGPWTFLREPEPTTSGFDWGDFGIGAGAGISFLLVLAGLGYGAWLARQHERQISGA